MTATPTAATPTPEELAARVGWPHESGMRLCGEKDIAAAIRQHSEGLRAEIERLTDESDQITKALREAVDDVLKERERATTAEAALAKVTAERDEAEGAIACLPRLIAVISKLTGAPMDDPSGYGLDDCVSMLEEHEAAVAGIGWQIGLTGETERADRAEKRVAAAVSDASRHERLWRAAMRGIATYRALLAASQERERLLREAAQPVADALRKHRTAMDAINAINEGGGDPGADIDALWREADAASEEIDKAMERFCAALQPQETADVR